MINFGSSHAIAEDEVKDAKERLEIEHHTELERFDMEKAEEHLKKALEEIQNMKEALGDGEVSQNE